MTYQTVETNETISLAAEPRPSHYPEYALYDATAVRLAAYLGGPLAGTSVIAINYSRLGEGGKAFLAIFWGVVVTVFGIGLGFFLPQVLQLPAAVAIAIAIGAVAQAHQGSTVEDHRIQGGRIASRWGAFGIGMLFLAAWVSILIAAS